MLNNYLISNGMNIKSESIARILEVNSFLISDFNSHQNVAWITRNIPASHPENSFDSSKHDAPFYCSSSLGVMLKYYQSNTDFKDSIDDMVSKYSDTKLAHANISELIDWILDQTSNCIKQDNSNKTDLQNVGWMMGQIVYVACIVSNNYKAQYEKLFIEAWSKYFTIENLGGDGFCQNINIKDYLSVIEGYIMRLNVPFMKKALSTNSVFYSFTDFSSGFVNIKVVTENNIPVGLSIRGLHKEMNQLANLAEQTKTLLNVPISKHFILEGDTTTPQIVGVI